MHIVQFIPHFLVSHEGTSVFVKGLSKAIVNLGHKVTIITYKVGTNLSKQNFQIINFRLRRCHPFAIPHDFRSAILNNTMNMDIIILHRIFNTWNLPVAFFAKKAGIPYVVVPHDPYNPVVFGTKYLIKHIYFRLFERSLLRGAASIHLLLPEHGRYIKRFGVQTPFFVAPNGFDPEEVPSQIKLHSVSKPLGIPKIMRILFLGRIDAYHKGLDLLLISFARFTKECNVRATLSLVGKDWGDVKKLRKLSLNLSIENQVLFCGPLSKNSYEIISQYDILVLPSRFDGFGLSVLEAMVCGKPILVSTAAGIARYVDQIQCGITVDPNPESIFQGLCKLWENRRSWVMIGQRGREFAFQNLTWDRIAPKIVANYNKILTERRNG
ncbi:hypothetical protein DRP53_08370 [candidate division WOR-3 bacterium]|uniref:Glycosyltransferase family 1 protein n=1 Tax=candidate division WOR-3 bacterium TaxID=2052148 RepID=A0A660SFE8_UNCW3|nr:MAG: hypothetical protein DRP53_08370 [candidate division WOR-3 bacterium]